MNDRRILELSDDELDQVSGGMRPQASCMALPMDMDSVPDGSFTPREYSSKSFEEAKQDVSNSRGQPTGGWNTARDPII